MDAPTKRCVVIGGSGVVGRAVCAALARHGAAVAFTYLHGEEVARQLQGEIPGARAVRLDLRDPQAIAPALDLLLEELQGIDALVYCAARGSTLEPARFDGLEEVTAAGWGELMAVNVAGAFFACQHLATRFGPEGGNVVLLGSIDGLKPVPSPIPYATSKAALWGLAISLSKALGKRAVRVNLVAPGVLEAGLSRTLPDELRAEYLRHCGLRRLGAVGEVAGLVTWLATTNTYVTGQRLIVDGGL